MAPPATVWHAPPMPPMTLQRLRDRDPHARRWAIAGMAMVLGVGLNLPGRRVRFVVEGADRLPRGPALLAMNHTHYIDWIALRWVAFRLGRMQVNWVKPRTYEQGLAGFLDLTGNVPLVSKGYLLSADVRALTGRAPTEAEYRALRDHLDDGAPLPEDPLFTRILTEPRDVLGLPFDPARTAWRAHVDALFAAMMAATLAHTRALTARGLDLAIMPQGSTAMRLTTGHPGAIQAALALDLPIVPVGVSGFPQAFGDSHALPRHGGVVVVRFGDPYPAPAIPGHEPFVPASERTHAGALRAATDDLMERINALLDPAHQWAEDRGAIDIDGVARFV
jgi:1-acyl-sn-glycerol-3-phosphate acyltransferase